MSHDTEFDDLRRHWRELESTLQAQHALNLELLTETRVAKARARLRPLLAGQLAQAVFGVACTVFFARFWIEHRDAPAALASGLLMHAWSVAVLLSAVVQILLVLRIDYALPLATVQKYLGVLQFWRTRRAPALGLAFWVLWVPLVEVLCVHATGRGLSGAFLGWNLAVGAAGLLATAFTLRHLRRRGHRIVDALDADNAGCGLGGAQALLSELKRFESR